MLYVISQIIKTKKIDGYTYPRFVFDEVTGKWQHFDVSREKECNVQEMETLFDENDILPVIKYPGTTIKADMFILSKVRNLYIAKIIDGRTMVTRTEFDHESGTYLSKRFFERKNKSEYDKYTLTYYIFEPISKVNPKDAYILNMRIENYTSSYEEKKTVLKNAFISLKKKLPSEEKNVVFKNGIFPIEHNKLVLVQSVVVDNCLENDDDIYLPLITKQDFDNLVNAILKQNIEELYDLFEILDYLDSFLMTLVVSFVKKRYNKQKKSTT